MMRWVHFLLILCASSVACSDEEATPVAAPQFITSFGMWGQDPGEFQWPRDVAVGPDSLLYVWDQGNSRIQVFTSDGDFRREWPSVGGNLVVAPDGTVCTAPAIRFTGKEVYEGFRRSTSTGDSLENWMGVDFVGGLQFDGDGNIYIYGRQVWYSSNQSPHLEGHYFWKFNSRNELVKQWGYPGLRDTTGWAGGPMAWNSRGNLLVLGSLGSAPVLFELTVDGEFIAVFPLPERVGSDNDLAVDRMGRIHISSWAEQRMYALDPWGKLLLGWSEVTLHEEPLEQPMGVALDASGFLYVVDRLRYRVVKYHPNP